MITTTSFSRLARSPRICRLLAHAWIAGALVVLLAASATAWIHFAGAANVCAASDHVYTVAGGETLGSVANHFNTSWQQLAAYNHLANPSLIYAGQTICIPGQTSSTANQEGNPAQGSGNFFAYGQCTWWAAQRYYQLHGIYIPWTTNSDAWQWTDRAYQFGWHVSSSPVAGSIIDLQPWVQGAYGLGHVAVVEQVIATGDVIASNMNWGANPTQVTDVQFSPGPGVTFLWY